MDDLIAKIEKFKTQKGADLSTDEDLSIAVMNLISLEEHFFFTASKTGKDNYLELLNQVRQIRKSLLARLMPENEGETWCISKHLLATTMRLTEVGTKLLQDKKTKEANDMFAKAYEVYSLFWAIKFKIVNTKGIKQIDSSKPWTYQDLITKLVDCCNE